MKAIQNVLLFIICISIGLFIVTSMGIGGVEMEKLQFWNSIQGFLLVGLLASISVIIAALAIQGGAASALASGVTLPSNLADAAALVAIGVVYGVLVGSSAFFFLGLPYVGWIVGPIFTIFALLVYFFSVIDYSGGNKK